MPKFGIRSTDSLKTADIKLQQLFNEVIKYFDCSVLYGHRTPQEQFELFKKGRRLENGVWVIDRKFEVVTYLDGTKKISEHNKYPSKAVDVMPYPIEWKNTNRIYMFVGFVRGIATSMKINIRCGADWDGDTQVTDQTFNDLGHFELIN